MMGTALGVGRAKNLYAYWSERITDVLKQDLLANKTDTVINLASSEYFKAVKPGKLATRVITLIFKDCGPGGYKMVMVFAKNQRGAMARHIIQHRILEPEKLKAYDGNGYRYAPEQSTADEWVYLREKKP